MCLGKGTGTGKARDLVAREVWHQTGVRLHTHTTRVDSKDDQSPGSSLVIKNSACNHFYKEDLEPQSYII